MKRLEKELEILNHHYTPVKNHMNDSFMEFGFDVIDSLSQVEDIYKRQITEALLKHVKRMKHGTGEVVNVIMLYSNVDLMINSRNDYCHVIPLYDRREIQHLNRSELEQYRVNGLHGSRTK